MPPRSFTSGRGPASLLAALVAVAWLTATAISATAFQQTSPPQAPAKPSDEEAAGLFVRLCNACHDTGRISSIRRTRADWEDQIGKMIEKGVTGTSKELETVFEYLLRTYGKVYINSAKADEIAAVLTLSQKDADSIVAYRAARGSFVDFDALKLVPGIDIKKLDARKDAIGF